MIEITGARARKDEKEKITKKGKLSSVKHGSKTFSSELQKTMAIDIDGTIDELMEDLKDQEKRFLDTQSEYDLLRYFAEHPNVVLNRQELQERVWKLDDYPNSRMVDNFILRLRKHFEPDPKEPRYFLAVRGAGYKFVPEP